MWPRAEPTRAALRVSFAVSVGLAIELLAGSALPFIGALFAAQFLADNAPPMPPAKALGLVILLAASGLAFMQLTHWFEERPFQLICLLGLFFFLCFLAHAHGRGGPAPLLAMVVAIMVSMLNLVQNNLDTAILLALVGGGLNGILLSWLAHALWPQRQRVERDAPPPPAAAPALTLALIKSFILLLGVVVCLFNPALSTAMVVPFTIAGLLVQWQSEVQWRAALALLLVNLLGAVLACLALELLALRPNLAMVFLLSVLMATILAGRAAAGGQWAKLHAGALGVFILLFGIGLTPLPDSAAETSLARLGYVAFAVCFALLATALLWRAPRRPAILG